MSVILEFEDSGPCQKKLKVEVPAPAVEAETQRVVAEFRRNAKLPGFRKGKVPTELVERKFKSDIDQEVIDRLVPRYWRQAEAEKQLEPLSAPTLDDVDLVPGEGLTFVARVEVRPEIDLGGLDGFDLPEIQTEPTADEVDEALEELRRNAGEWQAVDRAAARGDRVLGEIRRIDDEEGDPQPYAVELGDERVWEELSLELTGKSAGQEGEFERTQEVDGVSETHGYRVRVDTVQERELPELDDELAGKIGEFETVEALREDLEKRIGASKQQQRRREREKALTDQLRERHPLALPEGVVDNEIEGMLREYAESLASQGVDLEKAGIEWPALAEQVRPQAEKRVHARLLLDAAADQLEVEVEEADFEKALAAIARAQGQTTSAVRQALDRSGRLGGLRASLRRDKTLRRLLGEVEPGADAGAETEAESKDD